MSAVAAAELFVGATPSVLYEPYDDVPALELGVVPLDLGLRGEGPWMVELRPVVNLRILEGEPLAISHLGGTAAVQRRTELGDTWSLLYGPATTLARQRLFQETTWTFAGELGLMAQWERLCFAASAQPGMNLYLDTPVPGRTWLPHFGLVFRLGWWLPLGG